MLRNPFPSLLLLGVALAGPASLFAGWGSPPTVQLKVGSGSSDLQVSAGTSLTITGTATDPDGDLKEHWLEIRKPSGTWSWQGWLNAEPWLGGLMGSHASSTKSASFTFSDPGTYTVRSTAIDALRTDWTISNIVYVKVVAASTDGGTSSGSPAPAPKPTPAPTPTPTPTPAPTPAPTPTPTPTPSTPSAPSTPTPSSDPVAGSIFNSDGSVNQTAYVNQLAIWTHDSVNRLLGPTFAELNPNAVDDRPTLYQPPSRQCTKSYANKINPFELGPAGGCYTDSDYWSETGQVAYVPDDLANDPGLDRVQTFAYYNHVFAISPRLDWTGKPHPDPQTQDSNYKALLGFAPMHPVAMVRNYGMLSNEALVIYRDGLLGVAGTQTSREWYERPYPGLVFPSNKVPTSIALTTGNEFALVTIWDTQALKGQLAVVALEAKWLPFHTWPYMALPNQGSWSDMKLLGYIDLPMAAPSSVAAASNGWWAGPSQTANKVLSQISLATDSVRQGIYSGDAQWTHVVANKGYAIVASKQDNRAVIVDLTPLITYVRESYLSSSQSYWATVSNRGSGPGQWPLTFKEKPSIMPRVIWQKDLPKPTAVLAGLVLDRWSPDRHKAYIAREDGTIHIIDTSSLMARYSFEKSGALAEIGSFKVGRNPVSMAFARHSEYPLPLLPTVNGSPARPDPLNNQFWVACRGDRELDAVITYGGQGQIYRRIRDTRMGDPVAVSVAGRGYIVSVADFAGRKLLSFRIGALTGRDGNVYRPGADGKAGYDFAGQLSFGGYPIAINSANVN